MKKRIIGGSKIQLPDSMKKIPASRKPIWENEGCLVINQAGIDPSSRNRDLARLPLIAGNRDNPPPKSYVPTKLTDMILRLFRALGVPKRVADDYAKKSTKRKGEERHPRIYHAFLRGVADPTGEIPPNVVYITGLSKNQVLGETVMMTRSPSIKVSDGCRIKVLKKKPKSMSTENYDWLNRLPFGAVIFGFPKKSTLSMPERIADGDLDGDRYFVCWGKHLLKHMKMDAWKDKPAPEETEDPRRVQPYNKNWFKEAQDFLAESSIESGLMGQLTGKLYRESEKMADADAIRFMRNPDAEALADAYYQSLKNAKHGTKVELPKHLWKNFDKRHQKLFTLPKKNY